MHRGDVLNGIRTHRDETQFAFVIALNEDFEGGGTLFVHYNNLVIRQPVGGLSLHPGFVAHAGVPISAGTRYILAGFANLEPTRVDGQPNIVMPSARGVAALRDRIESSDVATDFHTPLSDVLLASLLLYGPSQGLEDQLSGTGAIVP